MRLPLFAAAAVLVASLSAHANTIDFNGSASNLTTYSEYGYNVVATSGKWHGGGGYGNPAPSAYVDSPGGTLAFSLASTGLFTFASADLSTAQSYATVNYEFTGFLNGTELFQQAGLETNYVFATFSSLYSGVQIDQLQITLNSTSSVDFNVDNVVLNAATTPEPSSIALLGTGMLGIAGVMRKRFAV